jgi:hypothetical protein
MARRAVVAIACAFTAVALTSCGSREAEVLGTAFQKHINSADLAIKVSVSSKETAFDATLAGPYQSRGQHKVPAFDFKLNVVGATPQAIDGRLVSTGENMFVEYQGETYELGEDLVRQAEREDASGPSSSFSPAEIQDLLNETQDWFPDSDTQENASLNGEQVTRVTGKLDAEAAFRDLARLIKARGGPKIGEDDIEQANDVIKDARFTVDVGKADGKLRRIAGHLKVDSPDDPGTLDFEVQWKDVDKPVAIHAPSSGKPIEELGRKLDQLNSDVS